MIAVLTIFIFNQLISHLIKVPSNHNSQLDVGSILANQQLFILVVVLCHSDFLKNIISKVEKIMLGYLLIFLIWWGAMALWSYTSLKKIFKKYHNVLRIQTPQRYNAFLRMDFGKWDEAAILRRSYTAFPARLTAFTSFMVIYAILALIHKYFKLPGSVLDVYRQILGKPVLRFCFDVRHQYDQSQEIDTALIVSNHVTWLDIIYYGSSLKSRAAFVAKKQISEMPVISSIATFLQCLIVDRRSAESRQQTIHDIKQRIDNFARNPKSVLPLIIFPEGTVSNGRSLLNFKNGAFDNLSPITLFSLRYESTQFQMGDNEMGMLENMFLSFCSNSAIIVKKTKVEPTTNQTSQMYRERCRKIIAQMGGFKIYDADMKEYFAYEKQYFKKLKELKKNKSEGHTE